MLYANGKGRYTFEYNGLWKKLVPKSGQAKTVQGELVRIVGRLADEAYRNGNANWDRGHRAYLSYLSEHLLEGSVFDSRTVAQIKRDLKNIGDMGSHPYRLAYQPGEDPYDRITDRVVEWCQSHPEDIPHKPNPKLSR